MEIHTVEVPWHSHADALGSLREVVFIEEQGVPREIEWDGQDEDSVHFIAMNELGQPVGCARLMPSGQIGRMAVRKEMRGNGIGFDLLTLAVDTARERGFTRVFLHAQTHAEAFYRKAGFLRQGDEFSEAGIPHVNMEMALPLPFVPPETPDGGLTIKKAPEPANPRARRSDHQRLSSEQDCGAALAMITELAGRQLLIYSPELDHDLFDNPDWLATLSATARRAANVQIKVLMQSSSAVKSRGHRMVELARRLPSRIEIRQVKPEYVTDPYEFAVADRTSYWLLPDYKKYAGEADSYDAITAERLAIEFLHKWEHSDPDPELRQLSL